MKINKTIGIKVGDNFKWGTKNRIAKVVFVDPKKKYVSLSIPPMKTPLGVPLDIILKLKQKK